MTEALENDHFNSNLAKKSGNVSNQKNIQEALSVFRGCLAIHCNHCGFYHCSAIHFIIGWQFSLQKLGFALNYFPL